MDRAPRFQFSVSALLLATTVVAVAVATVAGLDLPWSHPAVQSFLLTYLLFVGIWAIFRGPAMYRNVRDLRQRKRALAELHARIADELRQAKGGGPAPGEKEARSPFQD